jgi:ferric-dicitrate binding protein FerR (iron transport regulator)
MNTHGYIQADPVSEREIQEQAAYWLIEHEDPKFSGAARERFRVWLDKSPRHREVYEALARTWEQSLAALRKIDKERRETHARKSMKRETS